MATKHGSTWYGKDSEYTALGDTIRRGDGSQTDLAYDDDADAIARDLANGDRRDDEFEWYS